MKGIKFASDADDERFVVFFNIVQKAAKQRGKVFFLWAGEGREITTDELDGEDLSGWLVDEADADRFEKEWRKSAGDVPDYIDDAFVIARWSKTPDGTLSIEFE